MEFPRHEGVAPLETGDKLFLSLDFGSSYHQPPTRPAALNTAIITQTVMNKCGERCKPHRAHTRNVQKSSPRFPGHKMLTYESQFF